MKQGWELHETGMESTWNRDGSYMKEAWKVHETEMEVSLNNNNKRNINSKTFSEFKIYTNIQDLL